MAKYTATRIGADLVRLFRGETLFRSAHNAYAHWDGYEWRLSSGRRLSGGMLDAIDQLPLGFDTVAKAKAKKANGL